MVVSCCVIGCTSRFIRVNAGSFYRVPKKPGDLRKLWISAIRREGPGGTVWEPTDYDRVCFRHFISGHKSNDRSDPDSVPSINMGYKNNCVAAPVRMARFKRLLKREQDSQEHAITPFPLVWLTKVPETGNQQSSPHDSCMAIIAELRIQNRTLIDNLGRLQTENASLKQSLDGLRWEKQGTSSDKSLREMRADFRFIFGNEATEALLTVSLYGPSVGQLDCEIFEEAAKVQAEQEKKILQHSLEMHSNYTSPKRQKLHDTPVTASDSQ